MRRLLFCANWKMQVDPAEARAYATRFREAYTPRPDRETWFFPSAVSIEAAAQGFAGLGGSRIGAQDIHWEPKGAFTGASSVPLVRGAGASAALIGHSERRHVFGESIEETAKKLRAALSGGLAPVFCVGEKLEERERGETNAVVAKQLLGAVQGLGAADLDRIVVAYEPVWAIGTGRNATPEDAAQVHVALREQLRQLGAATTRILYGGSVNQGNVAALLGEPQLDGVLVGGASLDPVGWARIVEV